MTSKTTPIHRSLRLRLRIYVGIFLISLVILVVDFFRLGLVNVAPILVAFGVGLLFGIVASRMSRLSWNAADTVVVGRMDALGVVILLGYVLFIVFRDSLLAQWFASALVGVAGVSVLTGLMLGQVLGTVGGITRVIRAVRS